MNQVQHRRARATERIFRVSLSDLMAVTEVVVGGTKAESLANTAFSLLKSVKLEDPTSLAGKQKKSIIAGVVYAAQFYDGTMTKRIIQKKIAQVTNVTEPTIRKRYKHIIKVLKTEPTNLVPIIQHSTIRGVKFPPSVFFGEYPHDTTKDLHFPPPRFFSEPLSPSRMSSRTVQTIMAITVLLVLAGIGDMDSSDDELSNGEW